MLTIHSGHPNAILRPMSQSPISPNHTIPTTFSNLLTSSALQPPHLPPLYPNSANPVLGESITC